MMNKETLLTIGMPVYNDLEFIQESLDSILNQSFQGYELIIIDDCSTDGSGEICKEIAAKNEHIQYHRNEQNIGISKNMTALLNLAETEYFAWAGDDDIVSFEYFQELISLLETNPSAISAFCDYSIIDEKGEVIRLIQADYSADNPIERIKKLAVIQDDGFGYGVFRTSKIKNTHFPTWWWPNKESAYNNIYPSLCFYLASGPYLHSKKRMFYKRVKTNKNVHHKITGHGNAFTETFSYIIRRFNLLVVSTKMIKKGGGTNLAFFSFFILFRFWFVKSSWNQICLASNSFWKNRIYNKENN